MVVAEPIAPYLVEEIRGIGRTYGAHLEQANIRTTDELLERCATPAGRRAVAQDTGISAERLLRWARMADLMRIDGIGPDYARLLEEAGVTTVAALARRSVGDLTQRLSEANGTRSLVRQLPTRHDIAQWVVDAGVYRSGLRTAPTG